MVVQPSLGASAIPLSIEPVIGWRLWCVDRDRDGTPFLASPMRPYRWRPMVPNHAGCHRHVGKQVPTAGCTCGLYAVARLDRLPGAFGAGSSSRVSVVGSVAMWGRVVEHAQGYRGQIAYPDRIRLICRDCFFSGRLGVPTRVELDPLAGPSPVCDTHAASRSADRDPMSPDELEQALRSTYAVDLLPVEALKEAGFGSGRPPPSTFVAAAKNEAKELIRSGSGALAILLLLLAGVAMNVVGPFPAVGGRGDSPQPVASPVVASAEGPFADEVAARPRAELVHPPPEPPTMLRYGFVCGHRVGSAVQVTACRRDRAELFGWYEKPPGARRDCFGTWFTRKPNFSVCWIGLEGRMRDGPDLVRLPDVHFRDLASAG